MVDYFISYSKLKIFERIEKTPGNSLKIRVEYYPPPQKSMRGKKH